MNGRAFTLPELLLALVLTSVVSTAVVRLSISLIRTSRSANEQVQIGANLSAALAILRRELRPLDAADPAGSDLIEASESALVYRSMQGLYTVCGRTTVPGLQLVLRRVNASGLRPLGGAGDSLFVFAEGDAGVGREPRWLRAGVVAHGPSATCDDGSPGESVALGGILAEQVRYVRGGAPVRNFTLKWLRSYRDRQGFWWLGERQWNAVTGWSRTQPVVGPFTSDGVRFSYLDRSGRPATHNSQVARIRITLTGGPTAHPSPAVKGDYPAAMLESDIALRNSAR